jgi:hypothetical protein
MLRQVKKFSILLDIKLKSSVWTSTLMETNSLLLPLIIQLRFGMFALGNASSLLKATWESSLAVNLILQVTIVSLVASIEHASSGMLEVANALKLLEDTMMKYLMLASTPLVTD